jgi:hypothetical protein
VQDSLFGFRVYPLQEALQILQSRRAGRGYDFDTVMAVRLFWAGVRPINVPVPVQYLTSAQGGVSHFRYLRDNLLLVWRHTMMVLEVPLRWPGILRNRRRALAFGTKHDVEADRDANSSLPTVAPHAPSDEARLKPVHPSL